MAVRTDVYSAQYRRSKNKAGKQKRDQKRNGRADRRTHPLIDSLRRDYDEIRFCDGFLFDLLRMDGFDNCAPLI